MERLGCGDGRPPARRARGDRRPRHVLGRRPGPVHGAVERLAATSPAWRRSSAPTLVDRSHGGLTDDGARVVERARRVLREIDEIAAELAQHDGDVVGDVRLGMLGTTARWLLPRLLSEMSTRHPQVRVIVAEGSTSVLIPALLSGLYDAAIVHLPIDEPELNIEPLFAEDLLLLAGEGHPLAKRSSIHLAELAGFRLLLPPPGSALRRVLDRAALSVGAQLEAEAEVDGVRLLATLAVDGHGAAIVPATAVPHRTGNFTAVHVPELPPRVVALTSHRRPGPNGATKALFDVLRDALPAASPRASRRSPRF